mmetsp:Transcript_8154/g.20011  ORF Transcript_8154/g.20011 Transcript_8154/m.20011 type:complete len:237 (+) Transcript_8154:90-800(+)
MFLNTKKKIDREVFPARLLWRVPTFVRLCYAGNIVKKTYALNLSTLIACNYVWLLQFMLCQKFLTRRNWTSRVRITKDLISTFFAGCVPTVELNNVFHCYTPKADGTFPGKYHRKRTVGSIEETRTYFVQSINTLLSFSQGSTGDGLNTLRKKVVEGFHCRFRISFRSFNQTIEPLELVGPILFQYLSKLWTLLLFHHSYCATTEKPFLKLVISFHFTEPLSAGVFCFLRIYMSHN